MPAGLQLESIHTPGQFLLAILSIVLIDIVLAGDNAVVIALAVRTLPQRQRLLGILLGAGLAVLLRVALTAVAAQLMNVNYIKLAGGILILWIAVKLLLQESQAPPVPGGGHPLAGRLVDHGGRCHDVARQRAGGGGRLEGASRAAAFWLGPEHPLVVFTSNLLSRLMDRYPIIIYLGAAILGKVGGEMIMTDRLTTNLAPPVWLVYLVEAVLAAGVIVLALVLQRLRARPKK